MIGGSLEIYSDQIIIALALLGIFVVLYIYLSLIEDYKRGKYVVTTIKYPYKKEENYSLVEPIEEEKLECNIENKYIEENIDDELEEESEEELIYACEHCGKEVDVDATKCPNCGAIFEDENEETEELEYICDHCGSDVDVDATKCPNCGAIFEDENGETEELEYICDHCGSDVDVDATKCPNCGAIFEDENEETEELEYVCDHCGAKVKEDSTVCPECGLRFVEDEEETYVEDNNSTNEIEDNNKYICILRNNGGKVFNYLTTKRYSINPVNELKNAIDNKDNTIDNEKIRVLNNVENMIHDDNYNLFHYNDFSKYVVMYQGNFAYYDEKSNQMKFCNYPAFFIQTNVIKDDDELKQNDNKESNSIGTIDATSTLHSAADMLIEFLKSKNIDLKGFSITNCIELNKMYDKKSLYKLLYDYDDLGLIKEAMSHDEISANYEKLHRIDFEFDEY